MQQTRTPLAFDDQHNCFGCGAHNRIGMKLRFFLEGDANVVATLKAARRFQGPHGFVHGGVLAALLDEAMSKAIHAGAHGQTIMALTRHMETEYLRPVPLGTRITLRGREERVEGRKHFCTSTIEDDAGTVLARGKALFIGIAREPEHKH
jgi:uncharacterized protein (TIGR00369 family)